MLETYMEKFGWNESDCSNAIEEGELIGYSEMLVEIMIYYLRDGARDKKHKSATREKMKENLLECYGEELVEEVRGFIERYPHLNQHSLAQRILKESEFFFTD